MTDESQETPSSEEDGRPEQFKLQQAWLHGERERVVGLALDWSPSNTPDTRDMRSAQLLGETLLRMQASLGVASARHDILEGLRA